MNVNNNVNNNDQMNINHLPEEVLTHVFSFCDDLSLRAVPQVCRLWAEVQSIQLQFPHQQTRLCLLKSQFEALKNKSNYFKELSYLFPFNKSYIIPSEFSIQSFEKFMMPLYYLKVEQDDVFEALEFANYFQIEGLMRACGRSLSFDMKNKLIQKDLDYFNDLEKKLAELGATIYLNFLDFGLSNEDLALLKNLPIRSLDLSSVYNQITSDGLAYLIELPLEHLVLDKNITNEDLKLFKEMPLLQTLNLSRCFKITEEGIEFLKNELPNLKVILPMHLRTSNTCYASKN